jgi:hypothetical protein
MIDDIVVVPQSVQENTILVMKSLSSKTLKAIVSSNLCEWPSFNLKSLRNNVSISTKVTT